MTTLSNIPYEKLSIGQTGSGVNTGLGMCFLLLLIATEQQRVRVLEPA